MGGEGGGGEVMRLFTGLKIHGQFGDPLGDRKTRTSKTRVNISGMWQKERRRRRRGHWGLVTKTLYWSQGHSSGRKSQEIWGRSKGKGENRQNSKSYNTPKGKIEDLKKKEVRSYQTAIEGRRDMKDFISRCEGGMGHWKRGEKPQIKSLRSSCIVTGIVKREACS